jgi:hypothetical protein
MVQLFFAETPTILARKTMLIGTSSSPALNPSLLVIKLGIVAVTLVMTTTWFDIVKL